MKKLLSLFLLVITIATTQCIFVSCEKDDDDFYAGESEADYRPAEYTITSEWDFSKVSGLSETEKQLYASQFADAVKSTAVFNTREEAVRSFDTVVENLRTLPIGPELNFSGLKAKIYLRREGSIIKSATMTW